MFCQCNFVLQPIIVQKDETDQHDEKRKEKFSDQNAVFTNLRLEVYILLTDNDHPPKKVSVCM